MRMCVLFCVVSARTVARGGACVLLVGTAVELATAREEGSHDVRYLGITRFRIGQIVPVWRNTLWRWRELDSNRLRSLSFRSQWNATYQTHVR